MKSNRLCELLDIRYPIVQAPMNWVSGAELVAAVSNAGGLGTIGPNAGAGTIDPDLVVTAERLRTQIRKVRTLTKEPFAVNITVGVEGARQYSQKCVEVTLEEGVPVVVSSVGSPNVYTKVLKDAGVKVLHAVSTPTHAKKSEEVGVDAVICEGYEAGGHKGFTELTTFVLIPMVADAVKIPVIAGGGIADARGVMAAMTLGADGVYMGTRFMVSRESASHLSVKEAVVRGGDVCTVTLPKDIMLGRDLRNRFAEEYLRMREGDASWDELNELLNERGQYQSQVLGDAEGSEICCGQVAGMIDSIPSAGEIIQDIMTGILPRLEDIERKLVQSR